MADLTHIDPQRLLDFIKAQTMLLSDEEVPAEGFDAVYMPGLSEGMITTASLFAILASYGRDGIPIAFNGSDGEQFGGNTDDDQDRPYPKPDSAGKGWPGKDWYVSELTKRGVKPNLLCPTGPGLHTRHEMAQLALLAKEKGWKRIGIVTVAWHYSSIFTMLVNAMCDEDYPFAVYALSPPHTNWYDSLMGSQGREESTPFGEMEPYFLKLLKFQDAGRACSFADLFLYLRNRAEIAAQNSF